jgi:hypothetical protein
MTTAERTFRKLPRFRLPNILLFVYILAASRQYLWLIPSNAIAWVATFILAVSLFWLALRIRERIFPREPLSYRFALIVALPLLFIYGLRCAFPDISFDVLHYHIIAGERALAGFPSRQGDFFAVDFLGNPLADMVTAIYRHVLGYRAGTIVNYLALLWTGAIIVRFLRRLFNNQWLICLATLAILLCETLLFEINNYMVDLLAVPPLLEATYLLVFSKDRQITQADFYVAFLLGLSVALKLTSITYVVPLALLWVQRALPRRPSPMELLGLAVAFLFPVALYTAYLYTITGNPVYPFFQSFFTSMDLPSVHQKDLRWGPAGLAQMPFWPALLHWKVERISELHVYEGRHIYAGKIPLGFFLAICFLIFQRKASPFRALSFIMLLSGILWSATSGYVRYACYLEVIAGILIIYFMTAIVHAAKVALLARTSLFLATLAALVASCFVSLRHVARYEWSMRPTFFTDQRAYLDAARFFFRDYSLKRFICSETIALFEQVDVWIKTVPLTSSFQVGVRPEIPAINIMSYKAPSESRPSGDRAAAALSSAETKRMFSLCPSNALEAAVGEIKRWGMSTGRIENVLIPYFSTQNVYDLALIEVLPRQTSANKKLDITFSAATVPLPRSAFRATITPRLMLAPGTCFTLTKDHPVVLRPGSRTTIQVTVENVGGTTWPAMGKGDGSYKINLGDHWRGKTNNVVIADDARAGLLFDMSPGRQTVLPITVTAPSGAGDYSLEFDMIQEKVGWFASEGSEVSKVDVVVTQ